MNSGFVLSELASVNTVVVHMFIEVMKTGTKNAYKNCNAMTQYVTTDVIKLESCKCINAIIHI